MEKLQDSLYYKGYVEGYREAVEDIACGKTTNMVEKSISNLPIEAMTLSTRAYHCLTRAGCAYIADVTALSGHTIATMRNMGAKTASEIAHWLDAHGICNSAWVSYL